MLFPTLHNAEVGHVYCDSLSYSVKTVFDLSSIECRFPCIFYINLLLLPLMKGICCVIHLENVPTYSIQSLFSYLLGKIFNLIYMLCHPLSEDFSVFSMRSLFSYLLGIVFSFIYMLLYKLPFNIC